ncbi:expressed unknown protein [Ectocarpus siliculosus]|uniref:Thioredoxin domain-containing protein n=1 Tax=Ectocarpus siliculosus TaxID=2880 RepID=D8LC80_ECTSI|nr:expressed unknown protein [Ectocarpus siliculosus]|eukprot:CBN79263.1 expressed unknown protein [Ectocarpus siliculosus]
MDDSGRLTHIWWQTREQGNFHKGNSVRDIYGTSPHLVRDLGSPAVDFTLHDLDGNRWNLGEVLAAGEGKPVVLIFGMWTCPAYQGLDVIEGSGNTWSYWDEHTLVEQYGDKAIFVHIYGPEPHPKPPDLNFDAGTFSPNFWSVHRQPVIYDVRVEKAKKIRSITHPDEVVLPDYLTGNPYSSLNQPVWCTYANGARPSVMVSSSGSVFYQQEWLSTEGLGNAIDGYWEQDGAGTWDDGEGVPPILNPRAQPGRKKPNARKASGPNRP